MELEAKQKGKPVPEDAEIEALLESVRPNPGAAFQTRMAAQPWNRSVRQQRSRLAIGVVTLFLVVFITFSLPPVRVFGQRLLQFFIPTAAPRIDLQSTLGDLIDPQAAFNLSQREAETLAGFPANLPAELPPGFNLQGAAYRPNRQTLILNYINPIGEVLRIAQRRAGIEWQSIAPQANVEIVQVGAHTGEYVTGAWTLPAVQSSPQPSESQTIQANWDPNARLQILRWQTDEMLYEILYSGGNPSLPGYLTREDLIAIAETLP